MGVSFGCPKGKRTQRYRDDNLQSPLLRVPRAVGPAKAERVLQDLAFHVDDHYLGWEGQALLQLLVCPVVDNVSESAALPTLTPCSKVQGNLQLISPLGKRMPPALIDAPLIAAHSAPSLARKVGKRVCFSYAVAEKEEEGVGWGWGGGGEVDLS